MYSLRSFHNGLCSLDKNTHFIRTGKTMPIFFLTGRIAVIQLGNLRKTAYSKGLQGFTRFTN